MRINLYHRSKLSLRTVLVELFDREIHEPAQLYDGSNCK